MTAISTLLGSGGGGGIPVNGITPLKTTKVLHTDESENVWLKSGNIATDVENYPDATGNAIGTPAYSTAHNKQADEATPLGLALDETLAYVVGNTANKCWIYNKTTFAFVDSFDVGDTSPRDVSVDNKYIYITCLTSNTIRIFDKVTPFASVDTFPILPTQYGVAVNSSYMYISNYSFTAGESTVEIREKTAPFALVDSFYAPLGLYSINVTEDYIYPATYTDRVYTNNVFSPYSQVTSTLIDGAGETTTKGVAIYGNLMLVCGATLNVIQRWNTDGGIGIPLAKTDTDSGLPIYVRIK